jgi:general secretion pathway protein G
VSLEADMVQSMNRETMTACGPARGVRRTRTRALRRRIAARSREGMTLVEIMVVVIIMALIAAAVGVAVLPRLQDAKKKTAKSDCAAVNAAATLWVADHSGECPTVQQLLEDGALDRNKNSRDPWDGEYVIECDSDSITVRSAGPDKQMGTEDDISG